MMSTETFLKQRRSGIGGSDAAAVVGRSPWKTPMQVYLEKIGEEENGSPTRAMIVGKRMEPVILQDYTEYTDLKTDSGETFLRHPDHDWMICHTDRFALDSNGRPSRLVELKTVGAYAPSDGWGDDGSHVIPDHYALQVQHMLGIVGPLYDIEVCDVGVLFMGSRDFRLYEVHYDDDLVRDLIKLEEGFWLNHVVKRQPPMVDGSDASTRLLKRLYPESTDIVLEANPEMSDLIGQLKDQSADLRRREAMYAATRNRIQSLMGSAGVLKSDFGDITWRSHERKSVDHKSLLADLKVPPEKISEFTKVTTVRQFREPKEWKKEVAGD